MTPGRTLALLLSVAAALAALGRWLPAAVVVPAMALTFGFTPGWVLVRRLAPGAGPAWAVLLSLVLSPLLAGGSAAVALALGGRPAPVALAIAWGLAVLALGSASGLPAAASAPPRERETAVPWISGVALAALSVGFLLGNPVLLARADGWFHAAVLLQVAGHGLPVEDPFFAGLELLYFWGFHVHGALWLAIAPRLPVWAPLVSAQVAGALATMCGIALLARRLGAGARGEAAAIAVAVLGYMPFGWLVLLARVPTGDVRGAAEFEQLLTRGIGPVLAAMSPGTLHSSMVFFGDKYLIPTAFSIGYAAFLAFTLLLLEVAERARRGAWVQLGLVHAGALFLHSIVGAAHVVMAAGWGAWALVRSRRPGGRALRLAVIGVAVVLGLATLLVAPYLAAIAGGKRQHVTFGWSAAAVRTWLLAGALYVVPGAWWLARRRGMPGAARELLGLAIPLTLVPLLVHMQASNESKFFNLLFLLLAPPAALQLLAWHDAWRGWRRATLVAGLALATLPTFGLALWGFASERGQLAFVSEAPRHPGEREAWEWVARHAPPDAVVADPEAGLGMTVVAARAALWGGVRWADNWGYDRRELERRRRAVEELATGTASADTRALLRDLDRPLLLIERRYAEGGAPPPGTPAVALAAGEWTTAYENSGVVLHSWRGHP